MNYIGFSISIFQIKNNKNNNNRLLICKCDNADGYNSVCHNSVCHNAVGQGITGDRVHRKKVLVMRCALLDSIVSIACAFQTYLPRGVENAFVISPS